MNTEAVRITVLAGWSSVTVLAGCVKVIVELLARVTVDAGAVPVIV